jgi:multidrug resistance efflux pump
VTDPKPALARPAPLAAGRAVAAAAAPAVVWLAAAAALVLLAQATPSTGRIPALVDVRRADLLAPASGRIVRVAARLHDEVEADAVIARFDDGDVRLRLQLAQAALELLRAELAQADARLDPGARDAAIAEPSAPTNVRRQLAFDAAQAQLAALATRADLEEARLRLRGAANAADREADRATPTAGDAAAKRIAELDAQHERQRAAVATANRRLEEFAPETAATPPVDTAQATLRWRLQEQAAELERIARDAQALDVRAPMRGRVAALAVAAGDWIPVGARVAALVDPTPRRVLAYVAEAQRLHVEQASELELQRPDASPLGATRVVSVSPTTVRVPERLRRDPQREEWAFEFVLAATGKEAPGEHVLLHARR